MIRLGKTHKLVKTYIRIGGSISPSQCSKERAKTLENLRLNQDFHSKCGSVGVDKSYLPGRIATTLEIVLGVKSKF